MVLDLIVDASVEINPLFPSNRFILEACRIVTVDRHGLRDRQLKVEIASRAVGGDPCVQPLAGLGF